MAVVKEDEGGIVTTVKTETTSDLDVKAILDAQKAEAEENGETPETEEKSGDESPTGETKKTDDDDDDDGPLDFKSLSAKEQKLVTKALQTKRARDKRELRDLRDKTVALEAKLAGLEKGTPAPAAAKTVQSTVKPVRPKLKDYVGREDEYDQAMEEFQEADHAFRKAESEQEARAKAQKEADEQLVASFNEKAEAFMETHPDYEEVMDTDVPLTPVMFGSMLENGPELGYWFATHPEEAQKISKMADRQADKAIMKIVIKLEEEAAAEAKKGSSKTATASTKPAPITPVTPRGGKVVVPKDKSNMTFKERERLYAKEHPGVLNYEP